MLVDVRPVKPSRTYDGSRRKEAAARAHARLLDVALARFTRQGYAATTLESVADDVGVSVATIHKRFGGKPGLVRALCDRALAGEGPVPAEQRSDSLQAAEQDPRVVIEGWGVLLAEVSPRVAPILLLVRDAAAADANAAALAGELDASRLRRMNHNARSLVATGGLRAGLSQRDVRDVLWMYSAPELFDLLVRRRGWSVRKYAEFATAAMVNALL